jgi:glutaminyl-peptide cyclotransferase
MAGWLEALHMRELTVILFLHAMKNKKTLLILFLLALVAGVFLYKSLSPSSTDEEFGPLAYFEKEGNISCILGTDFNSSFLTEEDQVSVALYLDDSLIITYKNVQNKTSISIPKGLLTLGAHQLKITAKHTTRGISEDERVLYVLSDITPASWPLVLKNQYVHNDSSFTQGLAFSEGKLFEGTGDPNGIGATMIGEVDLNSGKIIRKKSTAAPIFGEGITVVGNELFQITWQNNTCFVYDKKTFATLRQHTYSGEGWGLTYDGTYLIMSDGSETLTFRDPKTFKEIKTIQVYTHEGAITKLNELEYIDGLIYANIWTSNLIAVIEPSTGKVMATIDATEAVQKGKGNGEVLNGIAHNQKTGKTYITGKFWPSLFEVAFTKPKGV